MSSSSSAPTSAAGQLLRRQLKEIQRSKDIPGISCGLVSDQNIFEWEVMLMINDDCKYYGGGLPLSPSPLSPFPLSPPACALSAPRGSQHSLRTYNTAPSSQNTITNPSPGH